MPMTPLEQQLFETCRQRNKELMTENRTLRVQNSKLFDEREEDKRYIAELERTLEKLGYDPNNKPATVMVLLCQECGKRL